MEYRKEKIIELIFKSECIKNNCSVSFSETYSYAPLKLFEKVEYYIYFEDTEKAKETLIKLSTDQRLIYSFNYPECLLAKYAIELLNHDGKKQNEDDWNELYEFLKETPYICLYYFFFGYYYVQNDDLKKAFSAFKESRIHSSLNQNVYMQAINNFHIAIQNDLENKLFEALKYYKLTNNQYLLDNNYMSIIGSYLNMADVYTKLYFWNSALNYYKKVLHDAKKFNDHKNIRLVYQNLSFNYLLKKDYNKAIAYAKKGLNLPSNKIATFNYMISWAYCELNDFPKAKYHYDEGKKHLPKNDDYLLYIYDTLDLKLQKDISSKNYEDRLLQLYKYVSNNHMGSTQSFVLDELCSYYKRIGDYKKVYTYSEETLSFLEQADQIDEENEFDEII